MGSDLNNQFIGVQIKIYKDIINESGHFRGDKSTAETRKSGYVYVFRKYPNGARNDDDTMTSFYRVIDLGAISKDNVIVTLPNLMFGKTSHLFFGYSQIELSDARIESLRLNLNKFIINRLGGESGPLYDSSFEYCRLTYIPTSRDYLFGKWDNCDERYLLNPTRQDADISYYPPGENRNATIYLYDWFGYLEELKQNYQETLEQYQQDLEISIDLSSYNTRETQNAARLGSYVNYDYSDMQGDTYPIRTLYPFTLAIQDIVNKKSKYRNNMRFHLEYPTPEEIEQNIFIDNRETGSVKRYDYKVCIDDMEEAMAPSKEACRIAAEPIVQLYTETYRRIHPTLIDYTFGSDQEKEEAEILVGQSLQGNFLFIGKEMSRRVEEKIIKETMVIHGERLKEQNNSFSDLKPQELSDFAGDSDYFTFSFAYGVARPIISESVFILDAFLNNIKNITREETKTICEYIQDGRYRNLTGVGRVVSTDKERLQQIWRNMGRKVSDFDYGTAVTEWTRGIENRYPNDAVRVTQEGSGKNRIDYAERIIQKTKKEDITPYVKSNLRNVMEVAESMGRVMDGFNILYQASCFKEMESGDEVLVATFSVLGSLTNLFRKKLETSITSHLTVRAGSAAAAESLAQGIVGSIGILFMALESGTRAVSRAREYDDDASMAYAFSAAAMVLYLIPGVNIPLWLCLGLSAAFALLGSYYSDEAMDVFLKYSLWGERYRKIPDHFPFWWPEEPDSWIPQNLRPSGNIILGDYSPQFPVSFNNNLDHQVVAINRINSIPNYRIRFIKESISTGNSSTFYTDLLLFELSDIENAQLLQSLEIELFQQDSSIHRFSLNPQEPQNYFMRGRSYLGVDEDIAEADTMRMLFIPSERKLLNDIKRMLPDSNMLPVVNRNRYLVYVPQYYRNNMVSIGNNVDFSVPFRIECTIIYDRLLTVPVTIVKDFP